MLNAFHSLGDRLEYLPDCQTDDCDAAALWIDLMTPTRAEELHVEQVIGAELPTRAEMEEIEPSSRLSAANDVLYLTAALPCRAGGNDPAITVVTFVLTEQHLVTVGQRQKVNEVACEHGNLPQKLIQHLLSEDRHRHSPKCLH